jgi:hypothetical protein
MFRDDLLVMSLSPTEFRDFIDFGFIAIEHIINTDGHMTFNGAYINRFGVFCNKEGNIYTRPVREHFYSANQIHKYYKMYDKLDSNHSYKKFEHDQNNKPIFDQKQIRDMRL